MSSSSEAFQKFEIWRNSKTPLKITVIVGGKTEDELLGKIAAIDSEASLVAVAIDAIRRFDRFNVDDAEFTVEESRVTVTRNESDWLIFAEEV